MTAQSAPGSGGESGYDRAPTPSAQVRRSASRFVTHEDAAVLRHSFSFGAHYDPGNVGFGALLAFNDITVAAGGGFPAHRHRDVEIVTWVVDGVLAHADTTGVRGEVVPGIVQVLDAGSGIEHTERNGSDRPLRFVQMWLRPGATGHAPGYGHHDLRAELRAGGLVLAAGGRPGPVAAPVSLSQPADLHVAWLASGDEVLVPAAPRVHLFVSAGSVDLTGVGRLDDGDAARLTGSPQCRARALRDAELIVWAMDDG